MTNRFLLVCLVAYTLVFAGLATFATPLLFIGVILLVYLGVSILNAPPTPILKVSRTFSMERISEGKTLDVTVHVTNDGQSLEDLMLTDELPSHLSLTSGQNGWHGPLTAGETIEWTYSVITRRGKYRFPGLIAAAQDHFGVMESDAVFQTTETVIVLPPVQKLHAFTLRPRMTRGFYGPLPARRAGSGVNFFGVRQYQMGDSLRWINWRISARKEGNLFTNEFEQEAITDVGLILDARAHTNLLEGRTHLFEHAVQATGALAEVLLGQGHRVSLLAYGFGIERVFPGYGKVQYHRILQKLAQVKPGQNFALESLSYLPTRLFPPRSQLIVISPLAEDDVEYLIPMRAQGYNLLVISPQWIDPASVETQAGRFGHRLARIERTLMFNTLRRAGIQTIEWNVDIPLDAKLHNLMLRQIGDSQRMEALQ